MVDPTPSVTARRAATWALGIHGALVLLVLAAVGISEAAGDGGFLPGIFAVVLGGLLGAPWWLVDSEIAAYYSWPVLNLALHAGVWWIVLGRRRSPRHP